MDAVEVSYPVDVSGSGFAGSEGFGVRDRGAAKDVAVCDNSSEFSSLAREKGATSVASALQSVSWEKVPCVELPNFPSEDVPKQLLHLTSGSNTPPWIKEAEEVQVQRKAGKLSRSGGGCSKRQRIVPLEDSAGPVGGDKDLSDKLGPYTAKIDPHDKTQSGKPKNNVSSKRGDRRNAKVSMKTKCDSFSVRAGWATLNSAAGGSSFLGLYGLKTDVHDITKLVDDLSLKELLAGTYECPSLGKEKGKKTANTSENILDSVRKACSILQSCGPAQFQISAEVDGCSNEKLPACTSNPVSTAATGDSSPVNFSSSDKDSCSKPETPANLLEFSFEHPKDTLERLTLPRPKDLEALLLDAAKPVVSSKHAPDPRPSKQTTRRNALQPFTWSHAYSGHCRTSSDASKLITTRSTCQGRWARISNAASCLGTVSDSCTDLESLVYDETLVPSFVPKLVSLRYNVASSTSHPCSEQIYSSAAVSMTSHLPLGVSKSQVEAEHSPGLLAAAQILCEMVSHPLKPSQIGMLRWPKKPSQKAMKARKPKSDEKRVEIVPESALVTGSDNRPRGSNDQLLPSKRPKLPTNNDTKKDTGLNGVRKVPINWSAPKSSRSSPSKSIGDAVTETRHCASYTVKQSIMVPPPSKVLNTTCNGHQKARRIRRMEWNR